MFLAFIPIANFWLLLARPKDEMSVYRVPTIRLLSGGLGVLSGLILLAATVGVNVYFDRQFRLMEQQAQEEPASQHDAIEAMIRSSGLEETLRAIAAVSGTNTPIPVDEVTTLARIEAAGMQLRRTYVVEAGGMTLTEEHRARSQGAICAWPPFEPILRAGGSIREVFVQRSGDEIGTVIVTRDECGF